jgi:hypothetical protein
MHGWFLDAEKGALLRPVHTPCSITLAGAQPPRDNAVRWTEATEVGAAFYRIYKFLS